MPRRFRTFPRRRRTMRRRVRRVRRVRRAKRVAPRANPGTGWVMNPTKSLRQSSCRVVKTLQTQLSITSSGSLGYFNGFDPSGTYGTTFGATHGIAEWGSFSTVFDLYRVNKIIVRIYQANIQSGFEPIQSNSTVYHRYSYDTTGPTPTLASIQEQPNVNVHVFSPEHPCLTTVIYPRISVLAFNGAALASEGSAVRKMGFVDTGYPVICYGQSVYFAYVVGSGGTPQQFSCDVTYDISFKLPK